MAAFLNVAPFSFVSTAAAKRNSTGKATCVTVHVIVLLLLSNVYVIPVPVVMEPGSTVRPIGTVSVTVRALAVAKAAMFMSLSDTNGGASINSPVSSYG